MGRVRLFSVLLLASAVLGWPGTSTAQDTKTARGTVTAMAGDSVTVKVGPRDMTFSVDAQTIVVAPGAGTRSRRAEAARQPGPKLSDVVKAGQAVIVTYRETGAVMRATRVQVVTSAGSGGGSTSAAAPAAKTGSGTVKSVAANSLTITAAGGKEMTFSVDGSTRVTGRGAGTKAAAAGGRTAITDLVKSGDRVSVTYHDMGGTMHLASVRVLSSPK